MQTTMILNVVKSRALTFHNFSGGKITTPTVTDLTMVALSLQNKKKCDEAIFN